MPSQSERWLGIAIVATLGLKMCILEEKRQNLKDQPVE
jgi:hypothetical protein